MTGVPTPASAGQAAPPRLTVHGRYGADAGFVLDSGSALGVYLRRQPGSANSYADNEAVWLVWTDAAGRMQLQVPARVRHCDQLGVRVQFEASQTAAQIEQVLALVPRKALADGAAPDPAERAVVLVVDAIRGDLVGACRNLLEGLATRLEREEADGDAMALGLGPREAAHQLRSRREGVEQELRRRLTQAWRPPLASREPASPAPLINDGEMRAWLAGRVAARALERSCEPAWKPLRQWLRSLLDGRPGPGADALSVVAIVDALAQSLHAAELDAGLQELVLQRATHGEAFELARCYERLAQSMQRAGIRNDSSPPAATPAAPGSESSSAPSATAVDPAQAWATLRRIDPMPAEGVDPNLLAGGGAIADSVLLRAVAEVLAAPGAAAEFRARLELRARQLSGNRRAALEWRQHAAIDLCTRVHRAIEEDPLLPAGFRERCRPLLKPLLAMELQGEGLDACAAALQRWLALVEFASELCASRSDAATLRIREAVDAEAHALAQESHWTAPALVAACERIDPLLQRARAASQASEKRVLETCAGQQRMADARNHLRQELATLFAGQPLLQALAVVVERRLSTTLLPVLLRAGPAGAEWRVAVGRLKLLHETLRQAAAGQACAEPERHLGWLREACAGPPDEQILERCLARIGQALAGTRVPWIAYSDAMASGPDDEGTPGGTVDPRGASLAADLRIGDWLAQQLPGGETRALRLVWRAADGGRAVCVNRLGQKAEDLDLAALADALLAGSLRRVASGASDAGTRIWARVLNERLGELTARATRDPATGLADRRELLRRLRAWLVAPRRTPLLLAWIGITGVDSSPAVQAAANGTELFGELAGLLQRQVDGAGYSARVADDAFVVVWQGLPLAQAERRAHACFEQAGALRFELEEGPVPLTLNLGLVAADEATATVERLLDDARGACATARAAGPGRWQQHRADTAVLSRMREAVAWVRRVDEALPQGGLVLYGQRASALAEGRPDYIEVLLRMRSADGVVAPGEFAIAVERYGQIAAMDRHILQELIPALRRVRPRNRSRIAFNISVRNLVDPVFVDEIVQTLRQQPVPLQQLCVELSAPALLQQLDAARGGMRRLADAGLTLALDGFDAGWSWDEHLEGLPFDVLKIPGAWLHGQSGDGSCPPWVRAVVEIARLLGKCTVAEHVADAALLEAVRAAGFDHAQGYQLGPPVPLPEALN